MSSISFPLNRTFTIEVDDKKIHDKAASVVAKWLHENSAAIDARAVTLAKAMIESHMQYLVKTEVERLVYQAVNGVVSDAIIRKAARSALAEATKNAIAEAQTASACSQLPAE